MKKIPRFSQAEVEEIAHLLGGEGIPFELEGTTTDISQYGGVTEYLFLVKDEDFLDALSLLMMHFRITGEEDEPFEGPCPACEAEIPGALECPDCGLSLSIKAPETIKKHPFYVFLDENGLLLAG